MSTLKKIVQIWIQFVYKRFEDLYLRKKEIFKPFKHYSKPCILIYNLGKPLRHQTIYYNEGNLYIISKLEGKYGELILLPNK